MDTKELKKAIRLAKAKWTVSKELTRGAETNYAMGLIPEKKKQKAKGLESVKAVRGGLPSKVDLTPFCTSVKNQGAAGTCVAFSTIGALELSMNIKMGQKIPELDLSEEMLFCCGGGKVNSGWMISKAMNYLKKIGVCSEACDPYTATDSLCKVVPVGPIAKNWKERMIKAADAHAVNDSDWKAWLAAGIPVVFAMACFQGFSQYKSGIYSSVTNNITGYHAVTIVGYGPGYWLTRNSWGAGWGEQGYFRLAMGDKCIQPGSGYVVRL